MKKHLKPVVQHKDRNDEYHWLRAENWQEVLGDPHKLEQRIRDHLEAENRDTADAFKPLAALRKRLYRELRSRIKEEDTSVPDQDGDYHYYVRQLKDCQYPVYCRRPATKPGRGTPRRETVLLDVNREAADLPYYQIGSCEHSPNHQFFAWTADTQGAESHTLYVREIENCKTGTAILHGLTGDFVWCNDSKHLVYICLDKFFRPSEVRLHKVGSPPETDRVLYREKDPGFFINLQRTSSRRFITINVHDHQSSEVHLIDARFPAKKAVQIVRPRQKGLEYEVAEQKHRLLILTNAEGIADYHLMECSAKQPDADKWKRLYTPEAGALLEDFLVFKSFIVCLERRAAKQYLVILDGKKRHEVSFKDATCDIALLETSTFDSQSFRFSFSSLTVPRRVYDYDVRRKRKIFRKQQIIPSGHNPRDYCSERLMVKAHDGEEIPVSILYHQRTRPNKSTPLLLYGYGAYGLMTPAAFSPHRLSLVKRGFVYVIAHVRGGKEKGSQWYLTGKQRQKSNTFSDFIAVAEHLITAAYTSADRLSVQGGSAGGMLIGAVLNQRPELFGAALLHVPFVDVLNTMCDASLPLTPPEWLEWGNPIRNKTDRKTIASYSPYENIRNQDYPAILVTAGLCDPRVGYWEAAKWAARLRALKTNSKPLLLRTEMSAGHAGASGRFDYLHEITRNWAFLLSCFKLEKCRPFPESKGESRGESRGESKAEFKSGKSQRR